MLHGLTRPELLSDEHRLVERCAQAQGLGDMGPP